MCCVIRHSLPSSFLLNNILMPHFPLRLSSFLLFLFFQPNPIFLYPYPIPLSLLLTSHSSLLFALTLWLPPSYFSLLTLSFNLSLSLSLLHSLPSALATVGDTHNASAVWMVQQLQGSHCTALILMNGIVRQKSAELCVKTTCRTWQQYTALLIISLNTLRSPIQDIVWSLSL